MNSVGERWRYFLKIKAERRTLNYISLCVYAYVCVCTCVYECEHVQPLAPAQAEVMGKLTEVGTRLPASMWVRDTKLRPSGVVAGIFLCRSSSLPRKQNF